MHAPATRRDKLRPRLIKQRADAVLVSNEANVRYLTGFRGDSSWLVVGRDKCVLISDGRYTGEIAEECPDLDTHIRRTTGEKLAAALAKVLRSMRVSRLAYERSITVAELGELEQELRRTQLVGWDGAVEALRARKDAAEIEAIRGAIGMAERAFRMLQATLRPSDTEKELADQMENFLRRSGAERASFETIIAVGERTALPHARPTSAPVREAAPLLVDWGASGPLYKSDLTRMLVVRKIPAKLEAVYEVVLRAQQRAISKIRPGVRGRDVDAEARAAIAESGYGRFFTHGTGHGIGLEIHEAPSLRPNSETVLQPGMVVTVEPGIYLRGWGGVRIEDDVLVTRDGHEVLSSLPKGLASVLIP
jgi:Xaa-Pro aminopeptidase